MANKFNKTKLAAAIGAAAVSLGLSAAANAVVVVGGDNGWEVSFDGNVNAFYVNGNFDKGWNPLGYVTPSTITGRFAGNDQDVSRVTSGFLPAFFSFNVKSPTVDGMYATARFSFAPTIQNSTTKNQLYAGVLNTTGTNNGIQGASIDTREVLVNLNAPVGVLSFGRTLSIFGRNAILKDMTLFGVGIANVTGSTVTAGRIGRGYTYPNFNARISYKTPVMSGFQAEVGLYDPSVDQLNGSAAAGILDQTDTPRFEGELTYTQPFSGGSVQLWFDGLWQNIQSTAGSSDVSVGGWGVGSDIKFMGFDFTGYYYGGQGLGRSLQFAGGTACNATGTVCDEAEDDGYYVQGSYTFNGVTKVGVSYGESNEDHFGKAGLTTALPNQDVSLNMWTVGVYHDVNSWLKLIAEYSSARNQFNKPIGAVTGSGTTGSDTFSIGSFFIW